MAAPPKGFQQTSSPSKETLFLFSSESGRESCASFDQGRTWLNVVGEEVFPYKGKDEEEEEEKESESESESEEEDEEDSLIRESEQAPASETEKKMSGKTLADAMKEKKVTLKHKDYMDKLGLFIERRFAKAKYPYHMYYGVEEIPRWLFFVGLESEQTRISSKVLEAILRHELKWCREEAEILGQMIGFLPWQVNYLKDRTLGRDGHYLAADVFSCPDAQPRARQGLSGDCEDISRMMAHVLHAIKSSKSEALRRVRQCSSLYVCFCVDAIASSSSTIASASPLGYALVRKSAPQPETMHQVVVLVAKDIVYNRWLAGRGRVVDPLPKGYPEVLMLETTDHTLTCFRPTKALDESGKLLRRWLRDCVVPDEARYPYPEQAFAREGYFVKFLTAYSRDLFEEFGIASAALSIKRNNVHMDGVSLDELLNQTQEISLQIQHTVTRQGRDNARKFVDVFMPAICDYRNYVDEKEAELYLQQTSSLGEESKTKPFPFYVPAKMDCIIRRAGGTHFSVATETLRFGLKPVCAEFFLPK